MTNSNAVLMKTMMMDHPFHSSPTTSYQTLSPFECNTLSTHSSTFPPMIQKVKLDEITIQTPTFLKLDIQDVMQAWQELYCQHEEDHDDEQQLPSEIMMDQEQ
ncbi:hypothetical protein C9374_012848 [Naegleria lovaniensis]|uniref:Uncharacterized protein n=1 Tax=Naegleria lovaniensis TaxID=51637 RepID=A0AA88KEC0_NAELO|nr:uncharacterized protein C9374_012848 [Naegleria lovaniensis]KAG2373116.1 hypothetical protein C9374_012848 [Naegleria lovaniensis]